MAKTYTSVSSVSAGDAVTSAAHNIIATNVNNLIVPPACWVYRTDVDTANNATWFRPAFNAEAYDTDLMHDNSTNSQRITFNTAGLYVVTAACFFNNASTAGGRYLIISKNATNADPSSATSGVVVASSFNQAQASLRVNLSAVHRFAVNDYITTHIYQDHGGAMVIGDVANPTAASSGLITGPTGVATSYHMSATWIGNAA